MRRALAISLALAAAACAEPTPAAPVPEPPVPVAAPATDAPLAEVELIDGDTLLTLVSDRGDTIRFVNFWATWCQPCLLEIPTLLEFAHAHPDIEVVLVSLDLPALRDTHVAKFVRDLDIRGVRVVQLDSPDPGGVVARQVWGWRDVVPFTLVMRPDGTRAATFPRQVEAVDLDDALRKARKHGPTVEPESSGG